MPLRKNLLIHSVPKLPKLPVFFSVVIPTYNRKPILEKCLRALEHQVYGDRSGIEDCIEGYEVVVVDDGSTDETVSWLQQHQAEFPHVKLFEQHHLGPAAARNLGVGKQSETPLFSLTAT